MARQSIHMATDAALSAHEEKANVRVLFKRFSTAAGGHCWNTPRYPGRRQVRCRRHARSEPDQSGPNAGRDASDGRRS